MYQLERDVEAIAQSIKHMVGRHDQRTHGNRFSGGGAGRSLVHHGGGASGHNVIRDANGEITGVRIRPGKKPKPADASIVTVPPGHQTVKGRDLMEDELLNTKTMQEMVDTGGIAAHNDGDEILASMYRDQGFDGKPDVVSEDELNAAIAGGEREFYRGTNEGSGSQFSDAFKSGEYYAGYGGYGNGTYMAYALHKNDPAAALEEAHGYGNSAMHLALKKDAKIGNYDTLVNETTELANSTRDDITALNQKMSDPSLSDTKYNDLKTRVAQKNALMSIYYDVGKYATSKGYDGYDVSATRTTAGAPSAGYFVLLNRTAVRVSTKLFKKRGY